MYLVIGATGNIGSEVTAQLIEQGHAVRALVRDPDRASRLPAGVEIAVGDLADGDLADGDSLAKAALGVDGVFYIQLGPSPAQAQAMIDAAHTAGVRKLVLLSSLGTRLFPPPMIGAMIAARDAVFRASGLEVTYLYASGLMSNALWWLPTIHSDNRVGDPAEPGKQGVVDPYDIARVAVVALTQDGHTGHGYVLTGPEALSPSEQTQILADVLGRPLEFVDITPEEAAREAIAQGTAPELAAARQNLDELFRAGRSGVLTDDVHNLTGVAPRPFEQWVRNHIEAFA